jgi:hypothetical protein
MSFAYALITALLTTALGLVVFVLGQFALKLIVEPIQEQRRAVGNYTGVNFRCDHRVRALRSC